MAKRSKPAAESEPAELKIKKTKKKKSKSSQSDKEQEPLAVPDDASKPKQDTKRQSKASSKKGEQPKKRKRGQVDDEAAVPETSDVKDKDVKAKKKKRKQSEESDPQQEALVTADEAAGDREEKTDKKKKKKKSKASVEPVEDGVEAAAKEPKSRSKNDKSKAAVVDRVSGDTPTEDATSDAPELPDSAPAAPDPPVSGGQALPENGSGLKQDEVNGKPTNTSFRRVKSEEWVGRRGSMDNTYEGTFGAAGWGFKAQQVLGQVRGKDFRHEKTKKKRGSYMGGKIDTSARFSFKYDSD